MGGCRGVTAGCPSDGDALWVQRTGTRWLKPSGKNDYPCECERGCSVLGWPLTSEWRHSSSHDLIHQQDVAGNHRAVKNDRPVLEPDEDNLQHSNSLVYLWNLTTSGAAVSWHCNCPTLLLHLPPLVPLKKKANFRQWTLGSVQIWEKLMLIRLNVSNLC